MDVDKLVREFCQAWESLDVERIMSFFTDDAIYHNIPMAPCKGREEIRTFIQSIRLTDELIAYIVDIIRATREHPSLQYGASPRSANMVATASRALAAVNGRDYVIPDDIKFLAVPILRHRVVLAPGAEIEGLSVDQLVEQILDRTPAPR